MGAASETTHYVCKQRHKSITTHFRGTCDAFASWEIRRSRKTNNETTTLHQEANPILGFDGFSFSFQFFSFASFSPQVFQPAPLPTGCAFGHTIICVFFFYLFTHLRGRLEKLGHHHTTRWVLWAIECGLGVDTFRLSKGVLNDEGSMSSMRTREGCIGAEVAIAMPY